MVDWDSYNLGRGAGGVERAKKKWERMGEDSEAQQRQRRYAELEAIKFGSRTSGSEDRQGSRPEVQMVTERCSAVLWRAG